MTITTPSSSVPGPIAKPRSGSTSSNYSSESSHIGSTYQRAPGSEREENTFVSIIVDTIVLLYNCFVNFDNLTRFYLRCLTLQKIRVGTQIQDHAGVGCQLTLGA